MELVNCKECGRVFASEGPQVCRPCLDAEEERFEMVRKFLIANPAANLEQASKATGVPTTVILRYLQQGRLQSGGWGKDPEPPSGKRELPDYSRLYSLQEMKKFPHRRD